MAVFIDWRAKVSYHATLEPVGKLSVHASVSKHIMVISLSILHSKWCLNGPTEQTWLHGNILFSINRWPPDFF